MIILAIIGMTGLLSAGGFFLVKIKGEKKSVNDWLGKTILYYGETCPHCLIVNKYLEENKVKEKFNFEHLEVYKNSENAKLLTESAKQCGIKTNEIGVPLLWSEGKCLVGDKDIIDFFKKKIEK